MKLNQLNKEILYNIFDYLLLSKLDEKSTKNIGTLCLRDKEFLKVRKTNNVDF